jgi:ABC-2 type transport system permease protein
MPARVRALSRLNPLSYEVDALRGLLLDRPAAVGTDLGVLVLAVGIGITVAASLLPRLTR